MSQAAGSAGTGTPGMRSRAARGSVWSFAGYGGGQLLRFASNLILTRMLLESDFGLTALVATFMSGLTMFSQLGLGLSVVQHARGEDPRFVKTAYTLQALRGLLLWLIACLGAEPFAAFYGEPRLAWLIPIATVSALVEGFSSMRAHSMRRQLLLGRLTVVEFGCQLLAMVVMVTWALISPSVLALIAGGLTTTVARTLASHLLLPGRRDGFAWDKEAVRELFHFGRWMALTTAATFFAASLDRLMLGKLISVSELGVYSVGAALASIPVLLLAHVGHSVLLPAYSSIRNQGRSLAESFDQARLPLLILGGWMLSGLAGGGSSAIAFLYDERFQGAGIVVQLLAIGGWFSLLETLNGSTMLAQGRPHWLAAANTGKAVATAVLLPLGFLLLGIAGAVGALAAAEAFKYLISVRGTLRTGLRGWPLDLQVTTYGALVVGISLFANQTIRELSTGALPACIGVFVVTSLAWSPFALRELRRLRTAVAPAVTT